MTVHKESVAVGSLNAKLAGALFLPESVEPSPGLIVCHGAGEFKENYFEMCEFLAASGVVCLAIDMHGHGESGGERFHVEISQWVADVQSAVDFLSKNAVVDASRIGAFGLSSGGTAILEAAMVDSRLKFLVPLDATVHNSMPLPLTWIFQFLIMAGRIKKRLTKRELRLSLTMMFSFMNIASDPEVNRKLKANPKAREAFMSFPFPGAEESFFVDTIRRAHRISVPTMVLWGEDDELDSPKTAQMLFDALTCKKRLHVIPGNGHVGHLDRNRKKVFELTRDWIFDNASQTPAETPSEARAKP